MGVPEYWRYDPADLVDPNQRPLYAAPLTGELLVNGEYQPIELVPGPEGSVMGYSPALGVSLAVKDRRLMVYDHGLGEFVAEFEEQERDKMQAQAQARAERQLRLAAEERQAAAEERQADEQARRAAAEEMRAAEQQRRAAAEEMQACRAAKAGCGRGDAAC